MLAASNTKNNGKDNVRLDKRDKMGKSGHAHTLKVHRTLPNELRVPGWRYLSFTLINYSRWLGPVKRLQLSQEIVVF